MTLKNCFSVFRSDHGLGLLRVDFNPLLQHKAYCMSNWRCSRFGGKRRVFVYLLLSRPQNQVSQSKVLQGVGNNFPPRLPQAESLIRQDEG